MKLFPNSFEKLAEFIQKNNELNKIIKLLENDFNLTPCFGVELEFYLYGNIDLKNFESNLGLKIKREKGKGQFEIDLQPSTNLERYAREVNFYKNKIILAAESSGGHAILSAKPFADDYGNSMHFHLNFIQRENREFTENLANILCNFMLETFLVFMPKQDDYKRIDKNFMTPTCVSFGGNNRSVAVRIPDSMPLRTEHRLSSPQADPYLVMFTILKSAYLGLKYPEKIRKYPKIHGNAFDEQYDQEPFPISRMEAEKLFNWKFFRHE